MKLELFSCSQCGASLEATMDVQFITCDYCLSQLVIRRDAGSITTETVESLDARTKQLEDSVQRLERSRKRDEIQARWKQTQDQYVDQNGYFRDPRNLYEFLHASAVILAIFTAILLFCSFVDPGFVIFFILSAFVLGICLSQLPGKKQKRDSYVEAYERYRQRLRQLRDG